MLKHSVNSLAIFRLFGPEDVYRLNQWLWAMIKRRKSF